MTVYSDFAQFMTTNFERWLRSVNADEDIDRLKQLILTEQFYERVTDEAMRSYLKDRGLTSLAEVARKADEYVLLHKRSGHGQQANHKPNSFKTGSDKYKFTGDSKSDQVDNNRRTYGARASEGPIICFGCKRPGHIRANCPAESSKAVRRIAASKTDCEKAKPSSEVSQCIKQSEVRDEHTYPVVVHGSGDPTHVWALRDTGATSLPC
jgi:hypothetical protein